MQVNIDQFFLRLNIPTSRVAVFTSDVLHKIRADPSKGGTVCDQPIVQRFFVMLVSAYFTAVLRPFKSRKQVSAGTSCLLDISR